jgi:CspA family cold shock protein
MDSTNRYKGTVIWFSPVKGYGFVSVGGQQAFVHYSQIEGEGYRNLAHGDRVEFSLTDKGKGLQAIKVKVVN